MGVKLFPHQIDALSATADKNRVAYYLDMGLGKTFVGSEKMASLGAPVNLLICQKSKIDDWITHLVVHNYERQFGMIYDCTKWDKKDWQSFSAIPNEPCVMVINYESAWRRKELLKLRGFTLMLDESSLIQNSTAKRTKFVLKLGDNAENVILLSGTPTSGKYENLWTQAHLLGWTISKQMYDAQYINWKRIVAPNGMTIKVVDKVNPYKNVDRLKRKFHEHGAVFMKTDEVMTLPEQTFITVDIPKPKLYSEFMKNSIVKLSDGTEIVGDTTLTKHLHCRQLCGQYCDAKLEALGDLIQSTNDRLVIFYNFTAELNVILKIIPAGRPYDIINGERKGLDAYQQHGDAIVLIQYQAGAMGLNLQMANKVIYYTLPERSDLFEQSKKRIHRIGQDKPCFYYVMMCQRTIEPDIYSALQKKQDYTDELFRGKELGV